MIGGAKLTQNLPELKVVVLPARSEATTRKVCAHASNYVNSVEVIAGV